MSKQKPVDQLNYEEAMAELEQVVAALDEQTESLEKALGLFERGQALTEHCMKLLDQAELKVQALSAEGELKDFEG